MPKELKQRMQDYFQTVWSLNHGIDIHEVKFNFKHFREIKIRKLLYPSAIADAQRISRGAARGREHALTSRNTSITHF